MPISIKNEVLRKIIHLSAILLLLPILIFQKTEYLFIYTGLFLAMLIAEYTRHIGIFPGSFIYGNLCPNIMRKWEKTIGFHLKSADQMILSLLLISLLFEKNIAITSFAILCTADAAASIFGKAFGASCRFKNGKSLIGTLSFIVTAFCVIICLLDIKASFAFAAAIALGLVELCNIYTKYGLDDNLIIPLSAGIILSAY